MPEVRDILEQVKRELEDRDDKTDAHVNRALGAVERLLDGEAIDPPKEFLGIAGIIESMRITRRAEETSRAIIAISVSVGPGNKELIAETASKIKQPIHLGFGFMQAGLDFSTDQVGDPNAGQPPAPVTDKMSVDGKDNQTVRRSRRNGHTPAGDVVVHAYRSDPGSPGFCLFCKRLESDVCHDAAATVTPEQEEGIRRQADAAVEP